MSNVRENNPRNRQMAKFRLQRLQKVMKCIKYEQVLFQLKLLFKLSNTYLQIFDVYKMASKFDTNCCQSSKALKCSHNPLCN